MTLLHTHDKYTHKIQARRHRLLLDSLNNTLLEVERDLLIRIKQIPHASVTKFDKGRENGEKIKNLILQRGGGGGAALLAGAGRVKVQHKQLQLSQRSLGRVGAGADCHVKNSVLGGHGRRLSVELPVAVHVEGRL
jgi:hypothetical protein